MIIRRFTDNIIAVINNKIVQTVLRTGALTVAGAILINENFLHWAHNKMSSYCDSLFESSSIARVSSAGPTCLGAEETQLFCSFKYLLIFPIFVLPLRVLLFLKQLISFPPHSHWLRFIVLGYCLKFILTADQKARILQTFTQASSS